MPEKKSNQPFVKYMEQLHFLCHEIKQPLTSVLLLSELSSDKDNLTNDEINAIYSAGLAARHALQQIQDLLQEWEDEEDASLNATNNDPDEALAAFLGESTLTAKQPE